jgi:hypothetical protein
MQGQRYWVERVFEDAKGQCGLADYQVQGWLAWHHHVTMVMLAMLFIAGVVQNLPFSGYTGVRKAPACEGRIATGRVSCAGGCAPPRGQACWG